MTTPPSAGQLTIARIYFVPHCPSERLCPLQGHLAINLVPDLSGGLPVMVMAVLMVRGFAAACSTSSCCSWSRRCWCRVPSRRCPVTPQCAFISTAATVAGRGRLALLDGGKAAVGSIKRKNTPRIILSARSSRKPVAEHDHANGEERQSHCVLPTSKRREARPR